MIVKMIDKRIVFDMMTVLRDEMLSTLICLK